MYDALTIAMYIIDKCLKDNIPVTNLRLQKLLYFVQLESYIRSNRAMFRDEIYAWQFGPVVPNVYYQYNMYGGSPILLQSNNLEIDPVDKLLIDKVISDKQNIPIWALVNITHEDGSPWEIAVNGGGYNACIEKELIMQEAQKNGDKC